MCEQASGSSGNLEIVDNLSSLEVQIELSQDPLKAEEKEQQRINGEKTSIRREETEPRVAVTSSGTLVPEPPPGRVQASVVVSSQVSCRTSKPTATACITKEVLSKANFSYSVGLRFLLRWLHCRFGFIQT